MASMVRNTPNLPRPERAAKGGRKGLAKVSIEQAYQLGKYSEVRKAFLEVHTLCELNIPADRLTEDSNAQCGVVSSTVHHTFGRNKYLLDTSTWLAGCWPCHDWVETHKNQAREMGLIRYK